jgi:hypothetical protein
MHTYLKVAFSRYDVGIWLQLQEGGQRFEPLFTVPSLRVACVAVNMLNGGPANISFLSSVDDER